MSLLSRSIFLLYDDVLGFFPSLGWKMYSPPVPVINLMSFSSKPTLFILLCNTGAGLCRHVSLLPAGLMLGFDNRSVGGTMQGWERESTSSGFWFQCRGKQISMQVPQQRFIDFGVQSWVSSDSFLITVLQATCSCENRKLFSEVWIQQFRTLFSEFLSLFLVPSPES